MDAGSRGQVTLQVTLALAGFYKSLLSSPPPTHSHVTRGGPVVPADTRERSGHTDTLTRPHTPNTPVVGPRLPTWTTHPDIHFLVPDHRTETVSQTPLPLGARGLALILQ